MAARFLPGSIKRTDSCAPAGAADQRTSSLRRGRDRSMFCEYSIAGRDVGAYLRREGRYRIPAHPLSRLHHYATPHFKVSISSSTRNPIEMPPILGKDWRRERVEGRERYLPEVCVQPLLESFVSDFNFLGG